MSNENSELIFFLVILPGLWAFLPMTVKSNYIVDDHNVHYKITQVIRNTVLAKIRMTIGCTSDC